MSKSQELMTAGSSTKCAITDESNVTQIDEDNFTAYMSPQGGTDLHFHST